MRYESRAKRPKLFVRCFAGAQERERLNVRVSKGLFNVNIEAPRSSNTGG
jgi:hypothetical protein